MAGQTVRIPVEDDKYYEGYLAVPASGRGPGLLLFEEVYGVNKDVRAVADFYAKEGYVVLAPDLFWRVEPGIQLGYSGTERQKGVAIVQKLAVDQLVQDTIAAVKFLRSIPENSNGKVGAIGPGFGGRVAFLAAARQAFDAVSLYYVGRIEDLLDEAPDVRVPVIFHFGGLDKVASPSGLEAAREAFKQRADLEFYLYPDADHGFANPGRTGLDGDSGKYDPTAAILADSRTLSFLRRTIGPASV